MTYKELYDSAVEKLDRNRITVGEYEEMIGPLNNEIITAEPKWIPVTERLPNTKGTYLVTVPQIDGASEFVYISVWTGNEWIPSNRILAWQSLPEPYKESEK